MLDNGITYVSSTYVISGVWYWNQGVYMCTIHNEVGNDIAISILMISHEGNNLVIFFTTVL